MSDNNTHLLDPLIIACQQGGNQGQQPITTPAHGFKNGRG